MEPDDDIIGAVLAGEHARFAALVERHGRALFAFLARRAFDRDEAREVFQASWVAALEGLAELRDRAGFRGWLFGIAQRSLLKGRRRPSLRSLDSIEDVPQADPGRSRGERGELATRIAQAVALLPVRQREVFELRAVHELSHAEVARLLEISAETSRANFHQAVRKLREALGDELE